MSDSTYFKMTTKSNHQLPEIELKYLLFSDWDTWNIELLKTESISKSDEHYSTYNIFKVVIFELDEEESANIIDKIKNQAHYLNIDLNISVIPHFSNNEFVLNFEQ